MGYILRTLSFGFIIIVIFSIASFGETAVNSDFTLAKKAFQDEFYDVAVKSFKRFLSEFPNDTNAVEAHLYLGEAYLHLNDSSNAIKEFDIVLSFSGSDEFKDDALYWKAEIYLRTKERDKARLVYNKLASDFPKSEYCPYVKYSLGQSYYEEGSFNEALDNFYECLSGNPPEDIKDECRLKTGEMLYRLKNYNKSQELLSKFVSEKKDAKKMSLAYFYIGEDYYYQADYKNAIRSYDSSLSLGVSGNDVDFYSIYGKAWSFVKLEKYEEAIREFESLKAIGRKAELMDSVLFGQSQAFMNMGEFEKSIGCLEDIIKSFPGSNWLPNVYLAKGEIFYKQGRYEDSANVFKDGLKRFPTGEYVDDMRYNLGWVYFKAGRYAEAIEEFSSVISNSDNDFYRVTGLCRLGDAYFLTERIEKAAELYDMVLKEASVNPDAVFGYVDYAQYQIAKILFKSERYDGAILAFNSLLKNYSDSKYIEDAFYGLGLSYFKKGAFEEAVRVFKPFLDKYRDSKYALEVKFQMATAYYNSARYKEALDAFQDVYSSGAGSDVAKKSLYEIAWCYYKMEGTKKALEQFHEYITKFPADALAADARFWLGEYYFDRKDFVNAENYFTEIIKIYPESELADDAVYRIAIVKYEAGDVDGSIKLLEGFNKKYPNSELVMMGQVKIAEFLIAENEFDRARDKLMQIMNDYSETAFVKLASKYLGDIYKKEGNVREAIKYYKLSLDDKRGDFNASIQYNIAELYEGAGDIDMAISEYMKVWYIYPDSSGIVMKAELSCARLFEKQKKWQDAEKLYKKIANMDIKETLYAKERLKVLEANRK